MRKFSAITPLVLASFLASSAVAQVVTEPTVTLPSDILLDFDATGLITIDPDFTVSDVVAGMPESTAALPADLDQLVLSFPGTDLGNLPINIAVDIPASIANDLIGSEGQLDLDSLSLDDSVLQSDIVNGLTLEDINAQLATIPADALAAGDIDLSAFSLIPLEALDFGAN